MALNFSKEGRVAVVQLNRPDVLNAIDQQMRRELQGAWRRIADDDDIAVAVLTGSGRGFCAGVDLREPAPPPVPVASQHLRTGKPSVTDGMSIPKPLVCAINGPAYGGGFELALACDLRIAADSAKFALAEVKVGSLPGAGGTQRLPRAIPMAVAMKMLLTGDSIDAAEALRFGLVSDVVTQEKLMPLAMELATRISDNAPLSVMAAKLCANRGLDLSLADGLVLESIHFGMLRDSEDRAEGRAAFREKRKPSYRGR